jgi:hypothetical protein
MEQGTQRAPESPRIIAEIFRSIGSVETAVKTQGEQIAAMHKAIFIGNGRKSIFDWLIDHDNKIARLLGKTKEEKKHALKSGSYLTLGAGALLLAMKLIIYLITGHWTNIP